MSNIVDTIKAQRDAYLDSPTLSQDWKHGWHAAVGHVAYTVEQEQGNRAVGEALAAAWQAGRESVALDMGKPLDEHGMRPATPNPYA